MSINKENIDYFELTNSYLSDELNDSQVSILEDWVKADSENKITFLAYKNAWIASNITKTNNNIDVNNELKNLQSKLFIEQKNISTFKKGKSLQFLIRIAAVIAIILAGIISINFYLSKKTITYTAFNNIIEQETPDGSIIDINTNSTVEYNDSKKIRNTKLKGTAFFKVKHNDKVPFIVETQNVKVSVLGTSFLIESVENENFINVIVNTGKVSMKTETDEIFLIAGEKGVYDKKEQKLYKKQNNDINFMSWKTKNIEFNNSELTEVVKTLSKTYNKKIIVDDNIDLNSTKLTAKFNKKSLKSVLNIIKETLDIDIKEGKDNIIILTEK